MHFKYLSITNRLVHWNRLLIDLLQISKRNTLPEPQELIPHRNRRYADCCEGGANWNRHIRIYINLELALSRESPFSRMYEGPMSKKTPSKKPLFEIKSNLGFQSHMNYGSWMEEKWVLKRGFYYSRHALLLSYEWGDLWTQIGQLILVRNNAYICVIFRNNALQWTPI